MASNRLKTDSHVVAPYSSRHLEFLMYEGRSPLPVNLRNVDFVIIITGAFGTGLCEGGNICNMHVDIPILLLMSMQQANAGPPIEDMTILSWRTIVLNTYRNSLSTS